MFKLTVSYSIRQFIEDLLRKRFHQPPKWEVNDSDNDKLNFACPYCGDSEKDANKKRGNFYLATSTYKCYNDGCGVWVKSSAFVSHFAQKYALQIPTLEHKVEFKASPSKRKGELIEFLINRDIGRKLILFSDLVERFSLTRCADAPPGSTVGRYIDSRKMRNLPVFEQSCYYDSREDKIYLFNLDLRSGRVLGFAIRRISDAWMGPRYDIKNYSELKKNGLAADLDDAFVQRVNLVNNYFNVLNIDFSQPVTLTEGQIDAMFVRNCIATTGITKGRQLLESLLTKANTRILFDRDRAGRTESLELIKRGYTVFLWARACEELVKKYPTEKKKLSLVKDVNDLFKFISELDPTLDFAQFNLFLDRHFSNSAFDLLFI